MRVINCPSSARTLGQMVSMSESDSHIRLISEMASWISENVVSGNSNRKKFTLSALHLYRLWPKAWTA